MEWHHPSTKAEGMVQEGTGHGHCVCNPHTDQSHLPKCSSATDVGQCTRIAKFDHDRPPGRRGVTGTGWRTHIGRVGRDRPPIRIDTIDVGWCASIPHVIGAVPSGRRGVAHVGRCARASHTPVKNIILSISAQSVSDRAPASPTSAETVPTTEAAPTVVYVHVSSLFPLSQGEEDAAGVPPATKQSRISTTQ